jgi:hypothetical protein
MADNELDDLEPKETAETTGSCELWDKRLDESQRAFNAFVLYRDTEKRSFKNVAERLNCSPQNVFQWSSRFSWRERASAWDVEQDRLQREELARGRMKMRTRHLAMAQAMLGIAGHALREWQARVEQKLPLGLSPEQIAMLVKAAVELEHRTMGTESEHRFTEIRVVLGGYEDEQAYEDALRGGKEAEPPLDEPKWRKPN